MKLRITPEPPAWQIIQKPWNKQTQPVTEYFPGSEKMSAGAKKDPGTVSDLKWLQNQQSDLMLHMNR